MARKPRVLFVDDEPRVLDALRRKLHSRAGDWDIEFFSSPVAAVERHRDVLFDVVVTDLMMPDLDGFGVVQALQEISPGIIPIILTGTADLSAAVKAINESNVFRFYPKPSSAEELAQGIDAALADFEGEERPLAASKIQGQGRKSGHTGIEGQLSVFDRLGIGVIAVDVEVRVVFSNRTGADLLAANDGLVLAANRTCRAATAEDTEKLRRVVRQTLLGNNANGNGESDIVLPLRRRIPARPLAVVAFPFNALDDQAQRLAVLLVHDPDGVEGPAEDDIARLLNLTASEARLTKLLADGELLEDASRILGLTVESGRTYLKRIFQKTGAKRQADLVRMVLTATLPR